MKAIVVLMDSVNLRYLECYGNPWVKTPNLSRLAARATVFDRHFVGSAPCMPARHDLLTGRLEFLEHNWCGLQPYDYALPQALREHGVFSHMETDHYHYFHLGGENYPFVFDSWNFNRGQEHDTMAPRLGAAGERPHYGNYDIQYELNRATFGGEGGYPTPRTFAQAAAFVDAHHADDNWLMFVDAFDPHEPFDVPDDFAEDYGDSYSDRLYYWPRYDSTHGIPPERLEHLRRQYAKTLTMADKWLGRLLDRVDAHGLWEDTLIVFTTDHGFLLGEKELLGKNYMPAYNEVYHIPLLIHLPGQTHSARSSALTQNIDLFPTILEHFGISPASCPDKLHGKSLMPLLRGRADHVRESAIYGMFGRQVNITDGHYTYFASAVRPDNAPLSLYTAMPTTINHFWDWAHVKDVRAIETGRFLKWTDYPVFRIPGGETILSDVSHRFDRRYEVVSENMLFDIDADYAQIINLCGGEEEARMRVLLRQALEEHDSPDEQYERLGLL